MSVNLTNQLTLNQLNQIGINKTTMVLFFDKNLGWVEQNLGYYPTPIEIAKLKYLQALINQKKDYTFVLGYRYFYNLKLFLLKGVFVPQYDTEGLIDLVLQTLDPKMNLSGFEIGFGSGAISLALANNSTWEIEAIDSNYLAKILAEQNQFAITELLNKVTFQTIDFFTFKPERNYDFIVSNPPYIAPNDPYVSKWVLANQPHEALFASEKGLKYYSRILQFANKYLKINGFIFLEMGFEQKKELTELFSKAPNYKFTFHKDLNDNWRFVILQKLS